MDALVAGTLIKEDPLNLGLLVGTPGWDPHLPGSRPPGFNGAGFGSSTTGPPYGFDPSTDIRRVANSNGKVTYFSSSGLARRLCKCVTVRNDASKALNAAVATQPAGEFDLQKSHCVSNSDHKSYINLPRCVVWRTSGYE